MSDTMDLTLEEFNDIYEEWNRHETVLFQDRWNMARMIAFWMVAPNVKKSIAPTDIMKFDWDPKPEPIKVEKPKREDFDRIRKIYGD